MGKMSPPYVPEPAAIPFCECIDCREPKRLAPYMPAAMSAPDFGKWTPSDTPSLSGAGNQTRSQSGEILGAGNLGSTDRGTGARFNAGKPAMQLMPLYAVCAMIDDMVLDDRKRHISRSLYSLANFQARDWGDVDAIQSAMSHLSKIPGTVFATADVLEFGAQKYLPWNWAKGMDWMGVIACAARHAVKTLIEGEDIDKDSGKPHEAAMLCNLVFLHTFISSYPEGDNRPAQGTLS